MPKGVQKVLEIRKGLVLVVGPTGSGKTTTLASMIDQHHLDPQSAHYHDRRPSGVCARQPEITHNAASDRRPRPHVRRRIAGGFVGRPGHHSGRRNAGPGNHRPGLYLRGTWNTRLRDLTYQFRVVKTIDRIINAFPAAQQNQIRSMLSESIKAVLAEQPLKTTDGTGRIAAVEVSIQQFRVGKPHPGREAGSNSVHHPNQHV